MPVVFIPALLAAQSAIARMVRGMFDDTFAGIHHLGWFDWAMLVPYFTILVILSIFGLHRYETIRTYFKHRKNATGEPPLRFEQLPPVTIQLPLYNERYVVERLIDEVVKVEYPKELLQIQVLDDSTNATGTWGIRSSITTAATVTGLKRVRCKRG
jgi:cellulose synthase/poly-beta-1,6-N-acetylglucosamine synthase-like glycosyltransferase